MGKHLVAARRLAALLLVTTAMPLAAQEAAAPPAGDPPATGDAPAPEAPPPATVQGRQSFTAADFARFAPTTALDMLRNVPGFQIKADQSGQRGLGQATENVLVNSQRLASKSDDLFSQLGRIPASSVVRIDIVDGATLSIPGLSGQVADIITKPDAFTGSYSWRGEVRPHFSHPEYTRGDVSVKGTLGKVEYSAAISNNDAGRGAFGGPYVIYNGDGSVRENRDGRLWSDYDAPKISAGLKHTAANGAIANLNASYGRSYEDYSNDETRTPVGGVLRFRDLDGEYRETNYEISGDYQFPLIGGKLKLIGLNRFERARFVETAVTTRSDGTAPSGGRYAQVVDSGEVIGRGEFSWKWGKADWQIAGEAAFNRLDKDASLFDLVGGDFVETPFPQGDGGVREDRYDGSISYSRPLTSKLSLQAILGGERSTIRQTGPQGISRSFFRPKGTFSLAWAPEKGTDISLKVQRAVGQLNFNDFLGRVFLDNGNQNGSNFELVPEQVWNVDLAFKKDLAKWGSTNLRLFYRGISDFVTLIPLPDGGEGRGNIPSAYRYGLEWTSTFKLDPIGFKGAKIDSNVILQRTGLTDPLTGENRQIDGWSTRVIEVNLRHDIPGSDWAWGAGFETVDNQPYYRLNEVGKEGEGPVFDFYFIEHKDVFGMTLRLDVINLTNARHKTYRTVYTGRRDNSPIDFIEDQSRLIGPIFRLGIKGNF